LEAMSISGELPAEGSDGEEVFINEEDIIHEITIDEEDLADRDDDDEDGGDRMGTGRILFGSAAFSPCACFFVCFFSLFAS